MWSDLQYLFKVKSTEFARCLDVGSEIKRSIKDDSSRFSLVEWH